MHVSRVTPWRVVVAAAYAAGQMPLSRDEIAARYPFYHLDDIVLGSINLKDEGYGDGGTVFDWLRRSARERGVEYVAGEVVAMTREADRIISNRVGAPSRKILGVL